MAKSSLDLVAKSFSSPTGSLAKNFFDILIRNRSLFESNAAAPRCGVPKKNRALVLKLILLKLGLLTLMVKAYTACYKSELPNASS